MHKTALSLFGFVALALSVQAAEWLTDPEEAKQRATAEHKAILVSFTGSDWCAYCMKLRKRVFETEAFEEYASRNYVLLEIDLPEKEGFDPALKERNQQLCDSYGITAFPTVLVLSCKGHTAGGFIGGRPGPDAVMHALAPGLENARRMERIYDLPADQQAEELVRIYKSLPSRLRGAARGLRSEILRLAHSDSEALRELHAELAAEQQLDDFRRRIEESGECPAEVLRKLDEMIAQSMPQNLPVLLDAKFNLQMMTAETLDDLEAARRTLLRLAELKPEYREKIESMIRECFADPELLLEVLRQERER